MILSFQSICIIALVICAQSLILLISIHYQVEKRRWTEEQSEKIEQKNILLMKKMNKLSQDHRFAVNELRGANDQLTNINSQIAQSTKEIEFPLPSRPHWGRINYAG